MPLLNGIKVACEPCIRGHRSTKCTHANERLMVPVRKPGRPLSTCPHATNQPCNCGHITAAIPRKQTCHCPDDVPPATGVAAGSDTFGELPSPTRGAYRVQKSSSRPPSSRKASSFDSSAFDRMNLGDFNVVEHKSMASQGAPIQKPSFGNPASNQNAAHNPRPSYIPAILDPRVVRDVTTVATEHIPVEVANNIVVNQRTFPSGEVIFHGNWGLPLTLAEKIAGVTKEGRPFPSGEAIGDIYPRTDLPLDMANDNSYRLYILNDPEKGGNGPKIPYGGTRAIHPEIQTGDVRGSHVFTRSVVPASGTQNNAALEGTAKKSCCGTKKETHSHNSSSASSISEPQDQPSTVHDYTPQVGLEESKGGIGTPPEALADMPLHGARLDFLGATETAKQNTMSAETLRHSSVTYPAGTHMYTLQQASANSPQPSLNQSYQGAPPPSQQSYAAIPSHMGHLYGTTSEVTSQHNFAPPPTLLHGYETPVERSSPHTFAATATPSTTLFTYPHTYGSYQNPFKRETYRQNLQLNNVAQGNGSMNPASFRSSVNQVQAATIHECCCGDGCECLGCAAHPYNSATQEYVRSAWTYEPTVATNDFSNISPITGGQNGLYGQSSTSPYDDLTGAQSVLSPTSSANGDEQNLSSADFFFVDYPMGDGCGGDTVSCPCGDDCQCFGCTIHKPGAPTQNQTTPAGKSSCCS